MMKTAIFQVGGMSCSHCERAIQTALLALPGVEDCAADAKAGEVRVGFDETRVNAETLKNEIAETGYTVI